MRRRLAAAPVLLLSACAALPAPLRVPTSPLALDARPPDPPSMPARGPTPSTASLHLTIAVEIDGAGREVFRAWCRVGTWTTLRRVRARPFTARESWGRLGERPPRLLTRVEDQVTEGIVLRVRPHPDGSVAFQVEVAEARVGPSATVAMLEGQRVSLPAPRRHGFRFAGTAPPRWTGTVAAWEPGVTVRLGQAEDVAPAAGSPQGALRFGADGASGFVAGRRVFAEAFRERWTPGEPIVFTADGIERRDFRLVPQREAAGFRTSSAGVPQPYGPAFTFEREE